MKNLALLVSALFLLTGCEDSMKGQLALLENTTMIHFKKGNNSGFPPRQEKDKYTPVEFPAQNYDVELIRNKEDISLKIELKNKNYKIKFNVPENVAIPRRNGSFTLTAEQSGQPFDVLGTIKTAVEETEAVRDWEHCQYRDRETFCSKDGCWTRDVWRQGNRRVEYYDRLTNQTVTFELIKNAKLGQFNGHSRYTERVYIYQGSCR